MSIKPHKINTGYALFLILLGIIAYVIIWFNARTTNHYTALVPALLGVVFFPMSTQIKRENQTITHIAAALTMMVGILMFFIYMRIDKSLPKEVLDQKHWSYGMVIIGSFVATGLYIWSFLKRRQLR